MMNYKNMLKGAAIGALANVVANYMTLGSLQPANIAVGLMIGGLLGVIMR